VLALYGCGTPKVSPSAANAPLELELPGEVYPARVDLRLDGRVAGPRGLDTFVSNRIGGGSPRKTRRRWARYSFGPHVDLTYAGFWTAGTEQWRAKRQGPGGTGCAPV
jgi:hypothetical protein